MTFDPKKFIETENAANRLMGQLQYAVKNSKGWLLFRTALHEQDAQFYQLDEKLNRVSTISEQEWIEATKKSAVMRYIEITGGEDSYMNRLSYHFGTEVYSKGAGRGEDYGISYACYIYIHLIPHTINPKYTLHLYDKHGIGRDRMLEGWTGYDHVVFEQGGYGDYNHPAWVTVSQTDTQGKKYGELTGSVFAGYPAYLDTQGRIWHENQLSRYPKIETKKPTAILWGSTGWGGMVEDVIKNSSRFCADKNFYSQDCYGGSRFPKDVELI